MSAKRKVTIPAGTDWQDVLSIFESPFVYHDVVAVARGWPTRLTIAAHGLPTGVTGLLWVQGCSRQNLDTQPGTPLAVTRVDADTIEVLGHSSLGTPVYSGGGRAALLTCATLTGSACQIQFKTAIDANALVTLTETSGVTVATRTLTIALTKAQTRLLIGDSKVPVSGVAQVELTRGGVTSRPWEYAWTVTPEWTVVP